jgi:hypothetical protein
MFIKADQPIETRRVCCKRNTTLTNDGNRHAQLERERGEFGQESPTVHLRLGRLRDSGRRSAMVVECIMRVLSVVQSSWTGGSASVCSGHGQERRFDCKEQIDGIDDR